MIKMHVGCFIYRLQTISQITLLPKHLVHRDTALLPDCVREETVLSRRLPRSQTTPRQTFCMPNIK